MTRKCEFSRCGIEFTSARPDQKFCCDAHRWSAAKERRKQLGATPDSEEKSTPTPRTFMPIERPPMDSITNFLFTRLENEIKDLKAQIDKKDATIEKLSKEKNDLIEANRTKEKDYEKQLTDLKSQIDAKPTGLQGFVQSTTFDKIADALSNGPIGNSLAGLIDRVSAPKSEHAKVINEWMLTLPTQVQNDVLLMLQGMINMGPEKMAEKISEVSRSFMEVHNTQTAAAQPAQKQLKGVGLGTR